MSILETFGIIFDSDAEEVKKGAEEAAKATENLEGKLKDVDGVSASLGDSFLDLVNNAKGAIASLLSVGLIATGIINTAKSTDEIGKFSDVLGLNVEDVHAWSEAVIRAGGDANAFRGSVAALTNSLTDLQLNGSGPAVDVLARLGVSAVTASGKFKTAFELLPDLADAFQGLSDAESVGFGQKLGLDQGTILLLQQGREAVEALINRQKELGIVTQEDYEIAARFNDQWADTKQLFNSVSIAAGSSILPALEGVLKGLEKVFVFLAKHSDLITGFFIGAAGAVTYFFLPAIVAAGAAVFAALSPILLIGGAIIALGAAFALIYEDIVKFTQGNESLIGKLADKYPLLGDIIKGIAGSIRVFLAGLSSLGEFISLLFTEPQKAFDKIINGLVHLKDSVAKIINDIASAFPDLGIAAEELTSLFREKFKSLGFIGDLLSNIFTLPLRSIDFLFDAVIAGVALIKSSIPDAIDFVSKSFDGLSWIGDYMIAIFTAPLTAINMLKDAVVSLFGFISDSFPDVSGIIDGISDFFSLDLDDKKTPELKKVSDTVRAMFGGEETEVVNDIKNIDVTLDNIDRNPLNTMSSTAITNSSQNNNTSNSVSIGEVSINTRATDAEGMAKGAKDALHREMQTTVNNFDDGIKA